jgi:hypothetical protein
VILRVLSDLFQLETVDVGKEDHYYNIPSQYDISPGAADPCRLRLHDVGIMLSPHLDNSHREVRYLLPKVISFVVWWGRSEGGVQLIAERFTERQGPQGEFLHCHLTSRQGHWPSTNYQA